MNIYLYLPQGTADWEIGYLTAEVTSKRFFRPNAPTCKIITVTSDGNAIETMGGISIPADMSFATMALQPGIEEDILVLPGSDCWMERTHTDILLFAAQRIEAHHPVAAICGATVALAAIGALNGIRHTSNDKQFLQMACEAYHGQELYDPNTVVTESRLITASGIDAVGWTAAILQILGVMRPDTLQAWQDLYGNKHPEAFMKLVQSLS